MAYLMDAYPEMVLEGMVGVAVINNTLAMVLTFTASKYYCPSPKPNAQLRPFFYRSLDLRLRSREHIHRHWRSVVVLPAVNTTYDLLG